MLRLSFKLSMLYRRDSYIQTSRFFLNCHVMTPYIWAILWFILINSLLYIWFYNLYLSKLIYSVIYLGWLLSFSLELLFSWVNNLLFSWVNNLLFSCVNNLLFSWVNNLLFSWVNNLLFSWVNNLLFSRVNNLLFSWVTNHPKNRLDIL